MPEKRWLEIFNDLDYRNQAAASQREQIRIPKFGYQETFELASLTRELAKEWFSKRPVIIDISLPNGHSLLRIGTDISSALQDDCWIQRKQKTAMRFGCSSFIMGYRFGFRSTRKIREFLDSKGYAFDGGALPIFIESCEYPVACLTISGLGGNENHWLAVESVRDYRIKINDLARKYTADSATDERAIDCAICLSEIQTDSQSHVTPCNHIFHNECLSTWKKYNPQCPLCRSEIPRG